MNSSLELIEKAKKEIKGFAGINLNTIKLHLGLGIVSANLLLEDLEELGIIKEFDEHKGIYEVL